MLEYDDESTDDTDGTADDCKVDFDFDREKPEVEELVHWCDIWGCECQCHYYEEQHSDSLFQVCKGCHLPVEDCECLSPDENEAI